MKKPFALVLGSSLLLAACTPTAADAPAIVPAPPADLARPLPARAAATELTVRAASCWLGGLWGDASGEEEGARASRAHQRCAEVVEAVYPGLDTTKLEQLRAVDSHALLAVRHRLHDLAAGDAVDRTRVDAVTALFDATAMAARESMDARRAAHRIGRDLASEPEMLRVDEDKAVEAFARVDALGSLLHPQSTALAAEARALGLLFALDRSGESRALPVGLKPYACAPVYGAVFGTPAPDITPAPFPPPAPGVWLEYVERVADSAGHRAPLLGSRERQATAAEAGILAGFADRLQASAQQLDAASPLRGVAEGTALRLREDARRAP